VSASDRKRGGGGSDIFFCPKKAKETGREEEKSTGGGKRGKMVPLQELPKKGERGGMVDRNPGGRNVTDRLAWGKGRGCFGKKEKQGARHPNGYPEESGVVLEKRGEKKKSCLGGGKR